MKKRRTKKLMHKSAMIQDDRVATGIDVLDAAIEGGIEKNSVTFVAGSAGSGKSIFSAEFIYNGITKYNEPGLYICFEEKKERFFKHMERFGWDLKKLEKEKKFIFLEYTPEQVKKMIEEGGGTVEAIMSKLNIQRLVIDSVTAYSLLFKDDVLKKAAALSLFELLRSWNVTSIVTGEIDEEDLERQKTGDIQFEADAVILLYFIKEQNIRKRALEILKMRGTKHANRIFPMDITTNGIEISQSGAVF
ncbi:MAG: ATPase domain-containing protein [Nanoarchaeota archaeon]